MSQQQIFRCINCGQKAEELYHDYRNGIIKLEHCTKCGDVVDKYIEFDPVFICLDALLLKRHTFCHVFNNSGIKQAHWKLTIIILLCDAYSKLVQQSPKEHSARTIPDYVIYSAVEWQLYWNFFIAAIGMAISMSVTITTICTLNRWSQNTGENNTSLIEKIRGLLLSNFGKILVLPAVLWGSSYSTIYLMLSHLFVFVSNIQAIRVMCPNLRLFYSITTLIVGHLVSMATTRFLHESIITE